MAGETGTSAATGPVRGGPRASTGPKAETRPPTRTMVSLNDAPAGNAGLCHRAPVRPTHQEGGDLCADGQQPAPPARHLEASGLGCVAQEWGGGSAYGVGTVSTGRDGCVR